VVGNTILCHNQYTVLCLHCNNYTQIFHNLQHKCHGYSSSSTPHRRTSLALRSSHRAATPLYTTSLRVSRLVLYKGCCSVFGKHNGRPVACSSRMAGFGHVRTYGWRRKRGETVYCAASDVILSRKKQSGDGSPFGGRWTFGAGPKVQ
jgi:hypothetical protein